MPRTSQGKFVTEAASVFQEGDDLWKAGKYDEAAAKYEKSAGLYHQKDDVEGEAFALTRLGELELSLDNFSRAAEVLKVAADLVKHKDFAQNTYGVGYKEDLVSMSNTMKSVLAINGDSYSNDGRQNSSTIIRNGKVYRIGTATSDVCVLYYDGTIKIYSPQEFDANQVIQDGAYQTWSFGPSLLDENGKVPTSYNTWDYIKKAHPRSAMGYYEPGHYAFVLVDGRNEGYSRGMTLEELSKVFEDLGCKSAYNLDGGHCSFMTLGTEIVNQPYESTDDISDGIFIGEYE